MAKRQKNASFRQKNFTLPEKLIEIWSDSLPQGTKESSKNAAGALFLYLAAPPQLQQMAVAASYEKNVGSVVKSFWERATQQQRDSQLARSVMPIQPEEKAMIMPDEDAVRFLEALFRMRKDVLLEAISRALPDTLKPQKRKDRRKDRSPGHKDDRQAAAQ